MDETQAWELLLSLAPGVPGRADPLEVRSDGGWSSDVEVGTDAATMLDIFAPLRMRERLVVGQLGQSVDGRIATTEGHSHYINGPRDIRRLHRLRALVQVVVVGAGTVASDDPRLTVRHVEGADPIRVVLDPSGRLDPHLTVFQDGAAPTLWVRAGEGDVTGEAASHVEIVRLPATAEGFDPHALLDLLDSRGLHRILVEGGGLTVSSFLRVGALHRLHLSVAPLILGSGRPALTLPPISTLDEALRPPVRHFRLGDDLLFDLELTPTEA